MKLKEIASLRTGEYLVHQPVPEFAELLVVRSVEVRAPDLSKRGVDEGVMRLHLFVTPAGQTDPEVELAFDYEPDEEATFCRANAPTAELCRAWEALTLRRATPEEIDRFLTEPAFKVWRVIEA